MVPHKLNDDDTLVQSIADGDVGYSGTTPIGTTGTTGTPETTLALVVKPEIQDERTPLTVDEKERADTLTNTHLHQVVVGARWLTIDDVLAVAERGAAVHLNQEATFHDRIERGANYLRRCLAGGATVYGVNTGYGDACEIGVPSTLMGTLPLQLTRFLGCGMGEYLDAEATLAVMVARLNSLAYGYSGVRWQLLDKLTQLINERVLPRIPAEGSVGATRDALGWIRRDIETELNSANDNPLIDPDNECVLHGGNFYGGHIAFAMDALKVAVANLADLMDRQLALLIDEKFNHGLPRNLSGSVGPRAAINHGFKAVQIGASAWTAEALKATMPASVFSRSTESHNQDKVSMGTIAARDCLRVLTLTEQVAAAHTLATVQAVTLRLREPAISPLPTVLETFMHMVGAHSAFVDEDRPLDMDLHATMRWIRTGAVPLYTDLASA
ncbi:hypothetical protein BGX24_010321 [Mortierella sp. AD032]|nr:hypothetical protein BGX24_010321 [Mortierella sp. AD032]